MSFRKKIPILIIFYFCFPWASWAQVPITNFQLDPHDRILIIAPHPDDEIIGTGGIIQQAVKQNIPLEVLYLTNGDNNELSFIIYEKRIVFKKNAFLYMGETRRKESIAAMKSLGVKEDQLIFLGYPDFGTQEIFIKYWGAMKPYESLFTRANKVSYKECLSYDAPFIGESVLNDFKRVISEFKPTKVFVTALMDSNRDHRAAYLFLRTALWDLEGTIPPVEIRPYLIHVPKWPIPRGYHPELKLDPPQSLLARSIRWSSFDLASDRVGDKKKAIAYFKSQNAYNPWYLSTFARQNELFAHLNEIKPPHSVLGKISWEDLDKTQGINEKLKERKIREGRYIRRVLYARDDNTLYVRIRSSRILKGFLDLNVYLISYKKNIPFARMPKYRININSKGKVTVFERLNHVFIPGVEVKSDGKDWVVKVPLRALGNPAHIFSSTQMRFLKLPVEMTTWNVLELM